MDDENPFETLAKITGQVAGLVHVQAGIIHSILLRQGLTTLDEIIEAAEGHIENCPEGFAREQVQLMIDAYRNGKGPVFTVIEGGKGKSDPN